MIHPHSLTPLSSITRSSEDSSAPVKRKAAERGPTHGSQQSEAKSSEEEAKWVLPEKYTERLGEEIVPIQVKDMEVAQWQRDGSFLGAAPLSSASSDTTSSSVAPSVLLEEKPFEFQPPLQEGSLQESLKESQTVPGQTNDSEDPQESQQEEEDASLSLWSLTVSGQTKRDRFIPLPWHSGEKHSIPWEPFSK